MKEKAPKGNKVIDRMKKEARGNAPVGYETAGKKEYDEHHSVGHPPKDAKKLERCLLRSKIGINHDVKLVS